jgi:hypothetical protein
MPKDLQRREFLQLSASGITPACVLPGLTFAAKLLAQVEWLQLRSATEEAQSRPVLHREQLNASWGRIEDLSEVRFAV